jgi:hypothetical protein
MVSICAPGAALVAKLLTSVETSAALAAMSASAIADGAAGKTSTGFGFSAIVCSADLADGSVKAKNTHAASTAVSHGRFDITVESEFTMMPPMGALAENLFFGPTVLTRY